jgi:hypothetical protein
MKITRENYETFFVDYLEGTLEENMIDEFIGFIQENPELREELLLFESVNISAEKIIFEKKGKLYKENLDSDKVFEKAAIASVEEDLTPEELDELNDYLNRKPEKRRDILLFEKTKLIPETISYTSKSKLYKQSITRAIFLWSARAAAILFLAWIASAVAIKKPVVTDSGTHVIAINQNNRKSAEKSNVRDELNLPVQPRTEITLPDRNERIVDIRQKTTSNQPLALNDSEISRENILAPASLIPLKAELRVESVQLSLAIIEPFKINDESQSAEGERFLADIIREKINPEVFSFRKLARSGLKLVSKLSNNKFTYTTNRDGNITEYDYDSRLLGLSIPMGKK